MLVQEAKKMKNLPFRRHYLMKESFVKFFTCLRKKILDIVKK